MNESHNPQDYFAAHPLAGPAYHPVFKGIATVLMMAIVFYAFRALEAQGSVLSVEIKMLFAAAGLTVLLSYYALLRSTTTIDGQGIRQSWMWKPPVAWSDIRNARSLRLPTASRLLVRTASGRFIIIHGGTPMLSAAFAAIARRYPPIA